MAEQKKRNLPFSYIVIFITAVIITISNFSQHRWVSDDQVIEFDVKSYYAYLPATFIYKDLSLSFLDTNRQMRQEIWPVTTPIGKKAILTTMGMSLVYMPFFLIGHTIATLSPNYEETGYSEPYRFVLVFGALVYLLIGLLALRKLLLRFYNEYIVSIVLAAIVFGTNLYYYASFAGQMPHAYNFGLISVFLLLCFDWHQQPNWKNTLKVGLLAGLITLIRPTNILVLLILILGDISTIKGIGVRFGFFLQKHKLVLLMIFAFFLIWVPQFIYWKFVSGKFLYFSYGEKDATFYFGNPQTYYILFSYFKGWYVYTPLMFFISIGIVFTRDTLKSYRMVIGIFLVLFIYVTSSWWCWWFGGAFGQRPFVDIYGIMALPLASVLDQSFKKKGWFKFAIAGLLILSVSASLFLTKKYLRNSIHWWWTNKEAFWDGFFQVKPTYRHWSIITIPNYPAARKGHYEELIPPSRIKLIQKQIIPDTTTILKNLGDSVYTDSLRPIFTNEYETQVRKNLENYFESDKALVNYIKRKARAREISVDSMRVWEIEELTKTYFCKDAGK